MSRPIKNREEEKKICRQIWDAHYWAKMARDSEFMPRFQNAMRIYMDQTIDEDEKRIIYERGQTDVSVNFLRFFLRKMQAFMTANQPQWIVFGSIFERMKSAYLANAVLGNSWRLSKGYLQVVDILKNGTIGGLGCFSNYIDYRSNNGFGDTKWKSLPVQYYYPDWRSKSQVGEDGSFQEVAFTVTANTAMRMAPDRKNDIANLDTVPDNYDTLFQEGAITYGEFPDPEEISRVRRIQHYQIEEGNVWELRDLIPDKNGNRRTFRLNKEPDLPLPYAVDIQKLSAYRLVKYDCFFGMGEDDGIVFDKTVFPFDQFLITQFINEFTGNPYGVGEAYFLEKLQKYIDKSLRVALQHEMWNSNPGAFLPHGFTEDIEKMRKNVMFPGFLEFYDPESGTPIFKQGSPGQSGFYQFAQFIIDAMRQGVGNMFDPTKHAKGNAKEDMLLRDIGQEEGDMIFRNFEAALEESAKAQLKLAKYHYTAPMLLKFIDERRRPQVVPVNRAFVNDKGQLDGYYLKDIDTDLAIATKSYAPTHKFAQAERIQRAMQFAPPQALDLLFTEWVKAMELDPELIDNIEMRMQIIPQLQQQLQLMEQTINELLKKNKQLESQVFTADRRMVRSAYDAELQSVVDKFKANVRAFEKIYQTNLQANEKIQKAITQFREAGKED